MIKQRQELVELYQKGNRADLVKQEQEEIAIISGYLPKQMSEAEMTAAIEAAIKDTGAAGMKDMGKVIGALARQICRADGHGEGERDGEGEAAVIRHPEVAAHSAALEGRRPVISGRYPAMGTERRAPSGRVSRRIGEGHETICRRCMAALAATPAVADDYPNRPIRVFTTSSAGGISDVFMRVLNDALQSRLGQPLIIENKPGGAGNIAARQCQDAAPDGYTICIINADTIIYNQFLFKQIPFEPGEADADRQSVPFDPGGGGELRSARQDRWTNWSRCRKQSPARSIISPPRSPASSTWTASSATKAPTGCACRSAAAARRSPPCSAARRRSRMIGIGNVMGQIKAGKMTALALVNNIRTPLLPDVPTWADLGYKGAASETWYGLFAPAGTPKAIIDKLNGEIVKVVADPAFREKNIISRGLVPATGTPEDFAKTIKEGRVGAEQVVKESGLPPQ